MDDGLRTAVDALLRVTDLDKSVEGVLERVQQSLARQDALPPPPDNAMRDLMAHEAVRSMRVDRDRALARKDMRDDDALLRVLEGGADPRYIAIVRMISLVARFAGELKHTLIHPTVRNVYEEHGAGNGAYAKMDAKCDGLWDKVMDPGLSGNARIACENLARALPQLQGLTVDMVLESKDYKLIDYFCAAVAARWRANTVFAAGPYKTGNEQNAVTRALKDAVLLCRDYHVTDSKITKVSNVPRAPTTLAELRGRGGPFSASY
jgi:hypothetical protein